MSEATLIDIESLKARISAGDRNLRLIHVTDAAAYAQHHIPGALLVTPQELVDGTPPASGRLPSTARLNALFSKLGYASEQDFVLYDDEGGGWAGRFAWTLDVIGQRRWQYLDGGIHAWAEAGERLETGHCAYPAPTSVELSLDTTPIAELDDVLAAIDDPQQIVWDVRSREEFLGQRKAAARVGHIPGARHLDWMLLKDPDRAMRIVTDLPELLRKHGIDPNKRVITHCQTHHRSGLSYMIGRLFEFHDIRARGRQSCRQTRWTHEMPQPSR